MYGGLLVSWFWIVVPLLRTAVVAVVVIVLLAFIVVAIVVSSAVIVIYRAGDNWLKLNFVQVDVLIQLKLASG